MSRELYSDILREDTLATVIERIKNHEYAEEDFNYRTSDEATVLHALVRRMDDDLDDAKDDIECNLLRILLTKVSPNIQDDYGQTPLSFVILDDLHRDDLMSILINEGKARIDLYPHDVTENPIHMVIRIGYAYILPLLLRADGVKQALQHRGENEMNAYMLAALYGRQSFFIQIWVFQPDDVQNVDNKGATALFLAARNRHLSMVKYLIRVGYDLDHRDFKGNSILAYAKGQTLKYLSEIMSQRGILAMISPSHPIQMPQPALRAIYNFLSDAANE